MGNDFQFIGKDTLSLQDIAYQIGRLSEDLRETVVVDDAKKRVREIIQNPDAARILGPQRIQGIWNDVRKMEDMGGIRSYLTNVSRFIDKEDRAKDSWENLAQYIGQVEVPPDAQAQEEIPQNEQSEVYAAPVGASVGSADSGTQSSAAVPQEASITPAEALILHGFGNPSCPQKALTLADVLSMSEDESPQVQIETEDLVKLLGELAEKLSGIEQRLEAKKLVTDFFNKDLIKKVFGHTRMGWIRQDLMNAMTSEDIQRVIERLAQQVKADGLPVPTEEDSKRKSVLQRWQNKEVKVETWFERDRSFVGIKVDATDDYIAEWWDDDVQQAFEDGFFERGKHFEQSVVKYADHLEMNAYPEKKETERYVLPLGQNFEADKRDEQFLGAMVPFGAMATVESVVRQGQDVEVVSGVYAGLRGKINKIGKLVEIELTEPWTGRVNNIAMQIPAGESIEIPHADVDETRNANALLQDAVGEEVDWVEAEEKINTFLDMQTRSIFNLKEYMDEVNKKLDEYGLEVKGLKSQDPAGEESMAVFYNEFHDAMEGASLDIRWSSKGKRTFIKAEIYLPASEDQKQEEELNEKIVSELETEIDKKANEQASEAWSNPEDDWIDEYGEVWVKAEFGDATAINGELVKDETRLRPPEGFEETSKGGDIPTAEEIVELRFVIDVVVDKLNLTYERVEKVADKEYKRKLIAISVSGNAEIWAKPKGEENESNKGRDEDLLFQMIYPEEGKISAAEILSIARDAEANDKIEGGFGNDVYAAIEQLADAGLLTIGNHGKPIGDDEPARTQHSDHPEDLEYPDDPDASESEKVVAPKIDKKDKKEINDYLYDLGKQYHKSIPLDDIRANLQAHGLDIEDAILTGRDGRDTFDLTMGGQIVSNSMLMMSWHKMEPSGNWEINAYLS
jgi:transcription antitermination factor NusG